MAVTVRLADGVLLVHDLSVDYVKMKAARLFYRPVQNSDAIRCVKPADLSGNVCLLIRRGLK
jgi:hypothetical protein